MFVSEYRDEIINFIHELIFLNSCNPGLVGTCMYGYYDEENNIEIINFYKELGDNVKPNYHNSFVIGDTRITNIYLETDMLRVFKPEITNGVIIYDRENVLSEIMTDTIQNDKKFRAASNELSFDSSFVNSLIEYIISNLLRTKDDIEKYNTLVNIFYIMISNDSSFDKYDFNRTISLYSDWYRFNGMDRSMVISAIVDAIKMVDESKLNDSSYTFYKK